MKQRQGVVFLSHWSGNAGLAKALAEKLDRAAAFIDVRSMVPGENNIEQMKEFIQASSVFVFIVSKNTPKECFSFFEAIHAEYERAVRSDLQIIGWPVEGATYKALPLWMQRYFSVPEKYSVSDVAREVRGKHFEALVRSGAASSPVYEGRENLERAISVDYRSKISKTGHAINAIVLTGLPGMGRTTLARHLPPRVFPAMRPVFPEFDLPEASDALDLYLALCSDLYGASGLEGISETVAAFPTRAEDQAKLIADCLSHWGEINQPVVLRMRWGLRERSPDLRPWFECLLRELKSFPAVRVIFVTSRRLNPDAIARHENIQQYDVPELDIDTADYILTKLADASQFKPDWFRALAELSAGHSATIHHVAFLINKGRSPETLLAKPDVIFAFQDRVLEAIYEEGKLTDLELNILWVLCWFPGGDLALLTRVFSNISRQQIAETLWVLSDFALIEQTQNGAYRLPAVVRSTFSRRIFPKSEVLETRVVQELKSLLESPRLLPEQLQPIVLALVSQGDLPDILKKAITPGIVAAAVETQYEKGRNSGNRQELERSFSTASKLAELALKMNMPADALESVLVMGADAMVRLGKNPEEIVAEMLKRGFVGGHYVRGSYLYHRLKDRKGAIGELSKVIAGRAFRRRSVRLLARIFLREHDGQQVLNTLSRLADAEIIRDSGFLVMKIRALRLLRRHPEADELEKQLKGIDDGFGEVLIYEATKAYRSGNIKGAKITLQEAAKKPKVNQVTLRFMQCLIDLHDGSVETLAEACALAEATGRIDDAHQLRARAALMVGKDWRLAEAELSKIELRAWFDWQLELQILAAKKLDDAIRRNPAELAVIDARREEVLRRMLTSNDMS